MRSFLIKGGGVASSTTIFCMDLIELTLGILKLSPIRDLGVCNTNYGVLKSKFSIFEWCLPKILLRHVDLTNRVYRFSPILSSSTSENCSRARARPHQLPVMQLQIAYGSDRYRQCILYTV